MQNYNYNGVLLKMGSYRSMTNVSVLRQSLNLPNSILTILLTCPNSDTLLHVLLYKKKTVAWRAQYDPCKAQSS